MIAPVDCSCLWFHVWLVSIWLDSLSGVSCVWFRNSKNVVLKDILKGNSIFRAFPLVWCIVTHMRRLSCGHCRNQPVPRLGTPYLDFVTRSYENFPTLPNENPLKIKKLQLGQQWYHLGSGGHVGCISACLDRAGGCLYGCTVGIAIWLSACSAVLSPENSGICFGIFFVCMTVWNQIGFLLYLESESFFLSV